MNEEQLDRKLYEISNRVCEEQGLELIELKVGRHKKDILIQILADKPQGGIILEECATLNRSIVESIDKEAFFSEDGYSLEVASPGLDRPILTSKDFSRNINAEIQVWLKEKIDGKGEYKGIVNSVKDEVVTLLTTTKDKKQVIIPIQKVLNALLVIK